MWQIVHCTIHLASLVQKVDSAIHWINHHPVENAVSCHNTYPLNSDLSGGQRYPTFEQPGPGILMVGTRFIPSQNSLQTLYFPCSIGMERTTEQEDIILVGLFPRYLTCIMVVCSLGNEGTLTRTTKRSPISFGPSAPPVRATVSFLLTFSLHECCCFLYLWHHN